MISTVRGEIMRTEDLTMKEKLEEMSTDFRYLLERLLDGNYKISSRVESEVDFYKIEVRVEK